MADEEEEGLGVRLKLGFEEAVTRTRISLRAHGFSIISEMPGPVGVGEGVGRRHLFMALWQQMTASSNLGGPGLDVGDHLPCNVAVFEEEGWTVVAGLDPTEGMAGWDGANDAEKARDALVQAFDQIA